MGRVCPRTRNHRYTFFCHTEDIFDHLRMFTHAERRGFTGSTYGDNSICTLCNKTLNQLLEALPIYAAIFKHWGDDCDNGTLSGLCLLSHFEKLSYLSIRRE